MNKIKRSVDATNTLFGQIQTKISIKWVADWDEIYIFSKCKCLFIDKWTNRMVLYLDLLSHLKVAPHLPVSFPLQMAAKLVDTVDTTHPDTRLGQTADTVAPQFWLRYFYKVATSAANSLHFLKSLNLTIKWFLDAISISTGCCKTSVKLWKHITETLYGVFFVFLSSFDCQIWAIFHFGTLWTYGWKKSWKIWPWKNARYQGWLKLANFLIS